MSSARVALARCLRGPYLVIDQSMSSQADAEFSAAKEFLQQAAASFDEQDEASGLKQAWGAMFRAARGLAYKAGYRVEQLRCLEVTLLAHYPDAISEDDIVELRRAQELVGPRDVALERARRFLQKAESLSPRPVEALEELL